MGAEDERFFEARLYALRGLQRPFDVREVFEQRAELIPAQARDGVFGTLDPLLLLRRRRQALLRVRSPQFGATLRTRQGN